MGPRRHAACRRHWCGRQPCLSLARTRASIPSVPAMTWSRRVLTGLLLVLGVSSVCPGDASVPAGAVSTAHAPAFPGCTSFQAAHARASAWKRCCTSSLVCTVHPFAQGQLCGVAAPGRARSRPRHLTASHMHSGRTTTGESRTVRTPSMLTPMTPAVTNRPAAATTTPSTTAGTRTARDRQPTTATTASATVLNAPTTRAVVYVSGGCTRWSRPCPESRWTWIQHRQGDVMTREQG